jgi:hypothetical protein
MTAPPATSSARETARRSARGAAAWRSARREAARRHHPDRGGTVQEYLDALAAVDASFAGAPVVVRRRAMARAARRLRRLLRRSRRRLPGAPRYLDL